MRLHHDVFWTLIQSALAVVCCLLLLNAAQADTRRFSERSDLVPCHAHYFTTGQGFL